MEEFNADLDGDRPGALLRVVVTGAESTGKTTLAARLAAHYGTVWVPEAARTYVDRHRRPLTYADVPAIARLHVETAAALATRARRVLVLDTDLLSTCLYSRYFYGRCPARVAGEARRRRADLYLLAMDDIPWLPDPGQRDGPEVRTVLQRRFAAALRARGWPHVRLAGTLDERLAAAVAAVDRLLEDRGGA